MKGRYAISDRNVVNLLMHMHDNEKMTSTMMSQINSNYGYIQSVAQSLCCAGIIE